MEVAQLTLEFIQTLIWPAVTMFALLLFRQPLGTILHRLKGAGLPGGISLDFDQETRKAQSLSRDVAESSRNPPDDSTPVIPLTEANARMLTLGLQPSPSGLDMNRYSEMVQQDPNVALAGLRIELEILARNLAKGFNVDVSERDSTAQLLRKLLEKNSITLDHYELAKKVVQLCNAAIHGTRVSKEAAERVIDVARVLTNDYLQWLSWGFEDGWAPNQSNAGD